MASTEDPKGAQTPASDSLSENGGGASAPGESLPSASEPKVSYSQTTDDPYGYGNDDPYSYAGVVETTAVTVTTPEPAPLPVKYGGGGGASPPSKPPDDDGEEEEDGMLRMSFIDHLEELRSRLIRMLMGVGVAFFTSMWFSDKLWLFVQSPAEAALRHLGVNPPKLIAIDPMEQFNIIW